MSEQNTAKTRNKSSKTKKAIIIAVSAVLIVAIVVVAVVLITRSSGKVGPKDKDGNPLYPKASDVTSIEYLHRGGIRSGTSLDDKELTDTDAIEDFLDQMKAIPLSEPTDKDRASVDYTGDVEMFTLDTKDGDVVLLIMGKTISITNQYGNYFYKTDGFHLKSLTKNFKETDMEAKLAQ